MPSVLTLNLFRCYYTQTTQAECRQLNFYIFGTPVSGKLLFLIFDTLLIYLLFWLFHIHKAAVSNAKTKSHFLSDCDVAWKIMKRFLSQTDNANSPVTIIFSTMLEVLSNNDNITGDINTRGRFFIPRLSLKCYWNEILGIQYPFLPVLLIIFGNTTKNISKNYPWFRSSIFINNIPNWSWKIELFDKGKNWISKISLQ
jgi:hypothetical protein